MSSAKTTIFIRFWIHYYWPANQPKHLHMCNTCKTIHCKNILQKYLCHVPPAPVVCCKAKPKTINLDLRHLERWAILPRFWPFFVSKCPGGGSFLNIETMIFFNILSCAYGNRTLVVVLKRRDLISNKPLFMLILEKNCSLGKWIISKKRIADLYWRNNQGNRKNQTLKTEKRQYPPHCWSDNRLQGALQSTST